MMVSVAACGGDEQPQARLGPSGPISLEIASLGGTGLEQVEAGSGELVPISSDCSLNVQIKVENFLLRPPGACAGAKQCGHVLLSVDEGTDGERSVRAAATLISVDVKGLGPVEHVVRVELRDDEGQAIAGEDGGKMYRAVKVRLELPSSCGASDASAGDDGTESDAGGDVTLDVVRDAPDAGDATFEEGDAPLDE